MEDNKASEINDIDLNSGIDKIENAFFVQLNDNETELEDKKGSLLLYFCKDCGKRLESDKELSFCNGCSSTNIYEINSNTESYNYNYENDSELVFTLDDDDIEIVINPDGSTNVIQDEQVSKSMPLTHSIKLQNKDYDIKSDLINNDAYVMIEKLQYNKVVKIISNCHMIKQKPLSDLRLEVELEGKDDEQFANQKVKLEISYVEDGTLFAFQDKSLNDNNALLQGILSVLPQDSEITINDISSDENEDLSVEDLQEKGLGILDIIGNIGKESAVEDTGTETQEDKLGFTWF